MPKYDQNIPDFIRDAASELKEFSDQNNFQLGIAQCHDLVSASLGYKSKVALKEDVDSAGQWLHREESNQPMMEQTIRRMNDVNQAGLLNNIHHLGHVIRNGLAPACTETGIRSYDNIPVGDPSEGDDTQWVNPSVMAKFGSGNYDYCQLCGHHTVFAVEDLDRHGLCPEHRGEFDMDPEEEEDMESFIENLTKDL